MAEDDEALIDPIYYRDRRDDSVSQYGASKVYRNFVLMCIAFSCNHGCVTGCLAYSTAELGDELGGYGSGCLYVSYALTALFVAKPIVSMIGPKKGLMIGLVGYCVYIGGFLIALLIPEIAWPVFIVAAIIGGVAGGLLWPSQGRYFAKNAKLYASAAEIPVEGANSIFAGLFAMSYLGLEMVTKVLATVVFVTYPDQAKSAIFSLYTIIAVASCFLLATLSHLDELGTWDFSIDAAVGNATGAAKIVYKDTALALMMPFQIAFGFASSFVPFYVFGTVVADSDALGGKYVGLLSAIIVLVGAVIALPAAWVANQLGKAPVMIAGGVCLCMTGAVFLFLSDDQLGTWKGIVPFLIMYGVGRGTWENTNKAVIADLFTEFPDFSVSAFSAVAFANGLAGSIGYFTFASIPCETMALLVALSSVLAIITYIISIYARGAQYRRAKLRASQDELGKYKPLSA